MANSDTQPGRAERPQRVVIALRRDLRAQAVSVPHPGAFASWRGMIKTRSTLTPCGEETKVAAKRHCHRLDVGGGAACPVVQNHAANARGAIIVGISAQGWQEPRDHAEMARDRPFREAAVVGLMPIYQKPNTSRPAKGHKTYPYLLKGLRVERPNQVWCADITYLPMRRGFLYLVVIMDWLTRRDHPREGFEALRHCRRQTPRIRASWVP